MINYVPTKEELEKLATTEGWDSFSKRIKDQDDYANPENAVRDATLIVYAYHGGWDGEHKDMPFNGNVDQETSHDLLDIIVIKALPHAGSKELAELWGKTDKWYS